MAGADGTRGPGQLPPRGAVVITGDPVDANMLIQAVKRKNLPVGILESLKAAIDDPRPVDAHAIRLSLELNYPDK